MSASTSNSTSSDAVVDEIVVDIDDDYRERICNLAALRDASYQDGRTRNQEWGADTESTRHERGVAGELVFCEIFGVEYDGSISVSGDNGVDTEAELGGEQKKIDVKTSKYDGWDPSLMVNQEHVEERPITPDSYVYVHIEEDLSCARLIGYVDANDIIIEDNLAEPKSKYVSGMNYEISTRALSPLPEPDGDLLVEDVDYRVVRS